MKSILPSNLALYYGLDDSVVAGDAQMDLAVCMLGIVNCQEKESIKCIEKILASPNASKEESHKAKEQSCQDDHDDIPVPGEKDPSATKPMSQLRQMLIEEFVNSTLIHKLKPGTPAKTIINAIALEKMQITGGNHMGTWPPSPENYSDRDPEEALFDIIASRVFPDCERSPESKQKRDTLSRDFKASVQQQLTDPGSALVGLFSGDAMLTELLNEQEKKDFPGKLTDRSREEITINNKACVVYCQAARNDHLKAQIEKLDIKSNEVDMLAKGHLYMNYFFGLSNLSDITFEALDDALAESDKFVVEQFFDSEIYHSHKGDANNASIAALWLMSSDASKAE